MLRYKGLQFVVLIQLSLNLRTRALNENLSLLVEAGSESTYSKIKKNLSNEKRTCVLFKNRTSHYGDIRAQN